MLCPRIRQVVRRFESSFIVSKNIHRIDVILKNNLDKMDAKVAEIHCFKTTRARACLRLQGQNRQPTEGKLATGNSDELGLRCRC